MKRECAKQCLNELVDSFVEGLSDKELSSMNMTVDVYNQFIDETCDLDYTQSMFDTIIS